jgi:superfamily II DNA or RNA helicase
MSGVVLKFRAGTIEIVGLPADGAAPTPAWRWDARSASWRAPALAYAETVLACRAAGVTIEDEARAYEVVAFAEAVHREPRPYQREAFAAWKRAGRRAVVVLPTGAGKTHLAVMAIADARRSTLVLVPTLDLLRQWRGLLAASFRVPVGAIGGGEHVIEALTVSTYDSAYAHMEHLGRRFGFLVFDEAHHLPSESYALAAKQSLAPFRLGLTATPERSDGREGDYPALVGPIAYRRDIVELSGEFLADYEVERVEVDLSPEERARYDEERGLYRDFIAEERIAVGAPDGWSRFLMAAARSARGRRAFEGYLASRQIAFAASAKLELLEHLLDRHRHDRAIVFSQDAATTYAVSKRFLIPAITHETKPAERARVLTGLADGTFTAVATAKVLNEGVDVPEANVAIVLSGSGSVREHVQRLGRVLRKKDGKRAVLYELVTSGTAETKTSDRRREHSAYR